MLHINFTQILWLESCLYVALAVISCVVTVPLPSLGMVLVRTDAGQLVMVPQQALAQAQMQAQVQTQGQGPASLSPRLSVPTAGPVFRLSTAQVCPAWFHSGALCLTHYCLIFL